MSDITPKKKKPGLSAPAPRPGAQLWILAGLLVFLFGTFWYNNLNPGQQKINQQRFETMLRAGDVRDITLINEKVVEVTLKAEALNKADYQTDLARRGPLGTAAERSPQFYFPVVDAKQFKEDLDKD